MDDINDIWDDTELYRVDFNDRPRKSSDLITGVLPNGMKYAFMSNDYKPNRVTSYLRVEVGSLDEEDDELGLAHFIEHMAFDRSKQFPTRGGGWDAITASGAGEFNAFTTFRTTTFQLFDVPVSRLEYGLQLHAMQVAGMDPRQEFVTAEAGAILGEARYRNSTGRIQSNDILVNHGGPNWRVSKRFTIGVPEQIAGFTAEGMLKFYRKWYRPERFTLVLVGNVTADTAVAAIKKVFSPLAPAAGSPATPPAFPADGTIKVAKPIVLKELIGVDGIVFHLMCTRPYVSPKTYNAAYFREEHLRKVFHTAYALLVHVRLAEMYPEEILSDAGGREASVKVNNEYQLGIDAHVLSVSSPGDPLGGTWRRDFDIAVTELRRLAIHGMHEALLYSLMRIVSSELEQGLSRSGWQESKSLADDILGSGDPDDPYVDDIEEARLGRPFLTAAFAEAAQEFVRAEARYLYRALVEAAGAEKAGDPALARQLFGSTESSAGKASLYVFMGTPADGSRPADRLVVEDIAKAIYQVEASVAPPNILIDHFMLVLSRGLSVGGVSIPGTAPPIGIPRSGSLFNRERIAEKVKMPMPVPLQTNEAMGIATFGLPNGVRVNVKLANSGLNRDPRSEPGRAVMHVVSLGGKATESPRLKNACKFVNLGLTSGYSATYYDNNGKFDTRDFDTTTVSSYFKGAKVPAKLTCQEEFFVIEKELHAACEIFPEVNKQDCDPSSHDYFEKLEGVRLAMAPMYDSRSVDLAAAQVRNEIEKLYREADPLDNLRFRGVERALEEKLFRLDTRMARASEEAMRALNPLSVQAWVREQFSPERIEINVAGDVDISRLIFQLNLIFGTLPRNVTAVTNATDDRIHTQHRALDRVGFDVYSPADLDKFTDARTLPRDGDVETFCSFPSAVPNRGFVTLLFPAEDFRTSGRTRFVVDPLVHDQVYNAIRREGGYAYYIVQESFHSVLFPGWGYHRVTWSPGTWPVDNSRNLDQNVENNIDKSTDVARSAYRSPISPEIYNTSLPQVEAKLDLSLSRLEDWLIVMRGISLPPPATWPEFNTTGWPGFKRIKDTDIKTFVNTTTTYQGIKDISSNVVRRGGAKGYFLKSSLQTFTKDKAIACPK